MKRTGMTGAAKAGKLFVVAVDGSRLGYRAVKLAAWNCNFNNRDKIKCVSVARGISAMEAMSLVKDGEALLRECGVPAISIVPGEVFHADKNQQLAEVLCRAASGGHLVMGAGGKRLQEEAEKRKGAASAALGSVALDCMSLCHAPVLLAKPKGIPALDDLKFLQKRNAGAGTLIAIAVDSSAISQKCFDMAVRMVKRGDKVKVINVVNTDRAAERPDAVNSMLGDSAVHIYYTQECSKATASSGCSFEFVQIKLKGNNVATTIVEYTEEILVDLLIMGSVTLAGLTQNQAKQTLGSVSANVAKKTSAHVLIAKHFADLASLKEELQPLGDRPSTAPVKKE